MRYQTCLAAAAATILAMLPAVAEQENSETTFKFEQVAALDGPVAALGTGMRQGIVAAFEATRRAGGMHARQIHLTSLDDGCQPNRSIHEVRSAISSNDYIGLIGSVGTPPSKAAQPIATEANMPFIAPSTGAGFLRGPSLSNAVNARATHEAETLAGIDYLVDELGYTDIAIFYQDVGFGRATLAGVLKAMDARDMSPLAEGTYTPNAATVKTALLNIRKAGPQAVVMIGADKPLAEFIRPSKKMKLEPVFVIISLVGSKAHAAELGADGAGIVISHVVPQPWDRTLPIIAEYQAALTAIDVQAAPGFVSREGCVAGADVARENLMAALNNVGVIDMGGITLSFGRGEIQVSEAVYLVRIRREGSYEALHRGS